MSGMTKPSKGPNDKFCNECGKVINSKAEICPHCGVRQKGTTNSGSSSTIKTILKWILIVFLILFVIGFIIGMMEDEGSTYQEDNITSSSNESVLEVSPQQIYRDYDSNQIAADNKYKGKLLKVTGTVDSINSDFVDEAVVEITAGGFLETVSAEGDSNFTNTAATLSKGQEITVLCRGAGEIMGFPMMNDCVFQ